MTARPRLGCQTPCAPLPLLYFCTRAEACELPWKHHNECQLNATLVLFNLSTNKNQNGTSPPKSCNGLPNPVNDVLKNKPKLIPTSTRINFHTVIITDVARPYRTLGASMKCLFLGDKQEQTNRKCDVM